ncbi:MAG TPA: hypothetical protein VJH34_03505 [archaeon]|nr:hypothetical protein [archaeon]
MANNIVIVPSFQKKLESKKFRPHLKIIYRLINKLRQSGRNGLKILDVENNYLVCEMKVNSPPYRLYVIVDQIKDTYYVVHWEHKKRQKQIINELKVKLRIATNFVLDKIFT